MAHLAEQLGRWFEALVFLTLAVSEDSDREDLRHELKRLSRSPETGESEALPHPGVETTSSSRDPSA
jgi:hypothetical protein